MGTKLSAKILKEARAQQAEVDLEEQEEALGVEGHEVGGGLLGDAWVSGVAQLLAAVCWPPALQRSTAGPLQPPAAPCPCSPALQQGVRKCYLITAAALVLGAAELGLVLLWLVLLPAQLPSQPSAAASWRGGPGWSASSPGPCVMRCADMLLHLLLQASRGAITAALQKLADSDGEDSDGYEDDPGAWDMGQDEVEVRGGQGVHACVLGWRWLGTATAHMSVALLGD